MSQALIKNGYKQAKQLLFLQFVLVLVVASLGLFKELKVAVALLSGGLGVVIANLYFTSKVFSEAGAQASQRVLRAFYLGEAVKFVILAGLVALAYMLMPGYEKFVLVGYITALLTQWLAPFLIKTQ